MKPRPLAWPSCGFWFSRRPVWWAPACISSAISLDPRSNRFMDLSVVIPIKDERDNLRRLHEQLRRALDPIGLTYEVIIVDDGSTDGSFAVLEELAAGDRRL